MGEIGLTRRPKRKPNGITKADREVRKSDDLFKRNFESKEPLTKCVTDMAGAHSMPVKFAEIPSANMESGRVWTAQADECLS